MTKKGQVTIFIIVGIVILILFGTVAYLNSSKTEGDIETTATETIDEVVPDEVLPFKRFIEACTEDLLYEALKKAGASGGEIYYLDFGRSFNYFDQVSGEGIDLFPNGDMKIPYWIYMEGDCEEGCTKTYKIPALVGSEVTSIQSQVEKYIETNIYRCLRSPKELESQNIYYYTESLPTAEVTFSDSDVVANLNYPFTIETLGEEYNVSNFRAVENLAFKKYYETAIYLAALVDEVNLFAKATNNWISLYSGMDSDLLPPKAGTDNEYISALFWTKMQVQEDLKDIIGKNIPLFSVKSSRNYHEVESDSFFAGMYNNYLIPGEGFEDYNINFEYHDWTPRVILNDDDNVIRPETSSFDWFPFFGLNRVRTMYTVGYPLKVTIENPDELLGDGFLFTFGLEVNIKDNQVINDTTDSFNYSIYDNPETADSLLCDIQNSQPVSFELIDGRTSEPLEGAILNFICGDENCPIGLTNSSGEFEASLPVCSGGVMQVLKPFYETIYIRMNPNIIAEEPFGRIIVEPYREVNYTVKRLLYRKNVESATWYRLDVEKNAWFLDIAEKEPDSREQIMIMLEKEEESTQTFISKDEFAAIALFENGTPALDNSGEPGTFRVLPGLYSGNILSVSEFEDDPIVFIPKKECEDTWGGLSEECEWAPKENMTLDNYAGAGAYFNGISPHIMLSKEDLDSGKELVFYEIYVDIPSMTPEQRNLPDLDKLDLESLSEEYWAQIRPKFR